MNELKFTPGPWESIPNDNMIRVKPQKDQGYLGGLYICHIEKFLPEYSSNAHLLKCTPKSCVQLLGAPQNEEEVFFVGCSKKRARK